MSYPYTATIEEKPCKIAGMDADGKYVLGNRGKIWIKPFKKRQTFQALKLNELSKLTFTGGEWLLAGKNIKNEYFDATIKRHESSGEAHTKLRKLVRLQEELDGLSDEDKTKIKGVAWFDEWFENVEGETGENCAVTNDFLSTLTSIPGHVKRRPLPSAKEFTPMLLADFSVSRGRRRRTTKPIARFEKDFTVAAIPKKNNKESFLTIEPELRDLIKKIIAAGGSVPRTILRSSKSDSYQPEKFLNSKVAKTLIKAKLFGTIKSGRTTVFWAKQRA